ALEAAGGNYLGAAKDFIKGGGGKWLMYGCGCSVLVVGGLIALIALAFIRMGEPSDFSGYTVDQSVILGTGITEENRVEVAEKIGRHIRDYTGDDNEFFKEIVARGITGEEEVNRAVGEAFIDSGYLETGGSGSQTARVGNKVYAEGNLSGKVIALEAGHGAVGGPEGKECSTGAAGVDEGAMNQAVVTKLKSKLEADDATVVLTRVTDCSEGRRENLRQRAMRANNAGADIALDIHHDIFGVRGTKVIVGPCDPNFDSYSNDFKARCDSRYNEFSGATLGNIVLNKLSNIYGIAGDGKWGGNYDFLRYAEMPAIIIEVSGSDDPDIDHEKSAQALYEAVHEYFDTNPTQRLKENQEPGVNIGLIMAIAKAEVEYTKPETTWKCTDCGGAKNAFNAQAEDSGLLTYSSWLEGVRAQGQYIYNNYGEQGINTVSDIAEARGEGEAWADTVRSEMSSIFAKIPELGFGGFYGSGDIVQTALEYVCANHREDETECSFDIKGGWGRNNGLPRRIPYYSTTRDTEDRHGDGHSGPYSPTGPEVLMSDGNAVDCSGLVSRVLREALPDKFSSTFDWHTCTWANRGGDSDSPFVQCADSSTWNNFVNSGQLMPGDLLLTAWNHSGCGSCQPCGHIMIYVGKDSEGNYLYIHSTRRGVGDMYDGPQIGRSSSLNFNNKWGIYRVK
ncbi:MAG: N-acetylmuramoyl-L-alanine amidase family protein, partial [Promethearchaeota archaeon]